MVVQVKEIRNKKYGGSMKQSEYELLLKLTRELKFDSQVNCLVAGLQLLEKQLIKSKSKEQGLFQK